MARRLGVVTDDTDAKSGQARVTSDRHCAIERLPFPFVPLHFPDHERIAFLQPFRKCSSTVHGDFAATVV